MDLYKLFDVIAWYLTNVRGVPFTARQLKQSHLYALMPGSFFLMFNEAEEWIYRNLSETVVADA